MKRILITGANSYVGTSFENYVKQWPDEYQVDTVSLHGDAWREKSFAGYDVILHVAGIAHVKETRKNTQLYFQVNRDLAIETANKAKYDGVKQFIFISSMSVYGMETGIITRDTIPHPTSSYGKSKLEAEVAIMKLSDRSFCVSIVRPPMIYGKKCKGNFRILIKIVKTIPVFPNCHNKRSMIYIENLCEFFCTLIFNKVAGVFYPQNEKVVDIQRLVREVTSITNKKIFFSKLIYFVVCLLKRFIPFSRKAFGDLIYKEDLECFNFNYCIVNFEESIKKSL